MSSKYRKKEPTDPGVAKFGHYRFFRALRTAGAFCAGRSGPRRRSDSSSSGAGAAVSSGATGVGSLGASAGSNFATTTGPTCVTVEPALGIYLYTSDYLDSSISGGQLSPNTGGLSAVQTSFFPSDPQPICVVSVSNGAHAVQETQP